MPLILKCAPFFVQQLKHNSFGLVHNAVVKTSAWCTNSTTTTIMMMIVIIVCAYINSRVYLFCVNARSHIMCPHHDRPVPLVGWPNRFRCILCKWPVTLGVESEKVNIDLRKVCVLFTIILKIEMRGIHTSCETKKNPFRAHKPVGSWLVWLIAANLSLFSNAHDSAFVSIVYLEFQFFFFIPTSLNKVVGLA